MECVASARPYHSPISRTEHSTFGLHDLPFRFPFFLGFFFPGFFSSFKCWKYSENGLQDNTTGRLRASQGQHATFWLLVTQGKSGQNVIRSAHPKWYNSVGTDATSTAGKLWRNTRTNTSGRRSNTLLLAVRHCGSLDRGPTFGDVCTTRWELVTVVRKPYIPHRRARRTTQRTCAELWIAAGTSSRWQIGKVTCDDQIRIHADTQGAT